MAAVGTWARAGGTAAVAVAAFVALGMPDGMLGVAWPSMRGDVDQPVGALGLVVSASTAGYLLSTVANGPLVRRLGTGRHLLAAAVLAGAGLAVIAAAPAFPAVLAGAAVLGFGAGGVDAGLNLHAALRGGVRLMNVLHAAYGVGTTIGPAVAAAAIAAASWRAGYVVAAALYAGVAAAVAAMLPAWAGAQRAAAPAAAAAGAGDGRGGRGLALLLLALFFVYTGVEVATGSWAFTLLTDDRGLERGAAAAWVSAYWGGLTAGRLLAGALGHRISATALLDLSIAGTVAGAALLLVDPLGAGALGLPLMGLALAAVFPTLVLLTPGRLGRERAATAVGHQLAAGALGAAGLTAGAGLVAEAAGVGALAPTIMAGALVLAAVHVAAARASRGAAPTAA